MLKNSHFYSSSDTSLAPIHYLLIEKSSDVFDYDAYKTKYDNAIFVAKGDLFNVPSKLRKNRKVLSYGDKGLQHDIMKNEKKCVRVEINYGEDKSIILSRML